jgi:hypothetical protein
MAAPRVGELERGGVQKHRVNPEMLAEKAILANFAVRRVAYHGMSDVPHMAPHLVPPSRVRFDLHQ